MNYHYLNSYRQPVGPVTEEQLKSAIRTEALLPESLVLPEGNSEWVPLSSLPEMAEELAAIANSSMGVQHQFLKFSHGRTSIKTGSRHPHQLRSRTRHLPYHPEVRRHG